MAKKKELSTPFSTGAGGANFEAHVQSSFVALMLTGGYAPFLPNWPIVEVKLQAKIDGYETDDLVVCVEKPDTKEKRKLLGQVKHRIRITASDSIFAEVMKAAWDDFNNAQIFDKNRDVIALIVGPLTKTDSEVTELLNYARTLSNNFTGFFTNVETAKFVSNVKREKLRVIRTHLKAANGGNDVPDQEFHQFLTRLYLLSYDLGEEEGVVLSLIHSHISQFVENGAKSVWSRIREFVSSRNQHAGDITIDNIPEDLKEYFTEKPIHVFPASLAITQQASSDSLMSWGGYLDAYYLALALLLGGWDDNNQDDRQVISQLLGIGYEDWLLKARAILHQDHSPLLLKSGVWKVDWKKELWRELASHILDDDLEKFKELAVSVLVEVNPAFELAPEERYAAAIHGKTLKYSEALRKGIAEGLAILGNCSDACTNTTTGNAKRQVEFTVHKLLNDADWLLWGSLNDVLPDLAEASPTYFLDAVEKAISVEPSPFVELFAQESSGMYGRTYITGLLWGLEALAWDESNLVRVCSVLADFANHDPGGHWANRPFNSLVTILLPWLPQTLAPIEKRKVAIKTVLQEQPGIAWKLIVQLLPGQQRHSSGTYLPRWQRIEIQDIAEQEIDSQEYIEEITFYTNLAVEQAENSVDRLSRLIEFLHRLPSQALESVLKTLNSQAIICLPEEERLKLWDNLTRLLRKHRRFSEAQWVLPGRILDCLEKAANTLSPQEPLNLYRPLFSDHDISFYDENDDYEVAAQKLNQQRDDAITAIFTQYGIQDVIDFAKSVKHPGLVGAALANIEDSVIDSALLPAFLDAEDGKEKALVKSFIWRRHQLQGWKWCEALDRTGWTYEQSGRLLACLPFEKATWEHANDWLQENIVEYWNRADVNAHSAGDDIEDGIAKLLEFGRTNAAIECLGTQLYRTKRVNNDFALAALLDAVSSDEPRHAMGRYYTLELIKYLNEAPDVNKQKLFNVEWAYLPLLKDDDVKPRLLERKLANEPEFFCEIIQLIYKPKDESRPAKEATETEKSIASNAWRLLHGWSTIPGVQVGQEFDSTWFNNWLKKVKKICVSSGHLPIALVTIGELLIHAPSDPQGLWIHKTIATALNAREVESMRNGYNTGAYNSRGAHVVDPTGKLEYELARQYKTKADKVEGEGFHRFAATLRDLAENYEREAEKVIARYAN